MAPARSLPLALGILFCRQALPAAAAPTPCIPNPLLSNGARCLTGEQCSSGNCCPLYRYCQPWPDSTADTYLPYCGGSGQLPTPCKAGEPSPSGDNGQGQTGQFCTQQPSAQNGRCKKANAQLTALGMTPVAFDLSHAECGCQEWLKSRYLAGTWAGYYASVGGQFVNACSSSSSDSSSGSAPSPAATSNSTQPSIAVSGSVSPLRKAAGSLSLVAVVAVAATI